MCLFLYLFFPHPAVVNRHPLLLLVGAEIQVRITVRQERLAPSAGFVPMRSSGSLKQRVERGAVVRQGGAYSLIEVYTTNAGVFPQV